jgi:serine/threonine protein kinase
VEGVLGQGGFGLVYLAHDDQLQRLVAIKVPHRKLIARPEDTEAYLTEARTVANLDQPNIVPVLGYVFLAAAVEEDGAQGLILALRSAGGLKEEAAARSIVHNQRPVV